MRGKRSATSEPQATPRKLCLFQSTGEGGGEVSWEWSCSPERLGWSLPSGMFVMGWNWRIGNRGGGEWIAME